MSRWTRRQSGTVRTTIRVDYEVPKDMVDWLGIHGGMSQRQALSFIREHIGELADHWHTLGSAPNDEVEVIHVDEIKEYQEDWGQVYDGPGIA